MIKGALHNITQIVGELYVKSGCDQLVNSEGNTIVDSNDNVLMTFPGNAPIKGELETVSYISGELEDISYIIGGEQECTLSIV